MDKEKLTEPSLRENESDFTLSKTTAEAHQLHLNNTEIVISEILILR